MTCNECQHELPDGAKFCMNCGADQRSAATLPGTERLLRRSDSNRKIAGVCGGLAEYFKVDVTVIRVLLVIVTIVPGALVGGIVAYLLAWLLMPGEQARVPADPTRGLTQSATNRKIGGVCGGLGEYFGVDPTAVRLLGVVLSIIPGVIVGGVLVYLVAWLVMPAPPEGNADSSVPDEFLGV